MGCGRATGDAQLVRYAGTVSEKQLFDLFLDGTGEPFSSDPLLRRCSWRAAVLDFTDVFAPTTAEEVFPLVSNKPFPDLRYTLGFRRFPMLRVKTLWC